MPIFPKRALVAIATTAIALALIFSFRTPDATTGRAASAPAAITTDQGVGGPGAAASSPPSGAGGAIAGTSGGSGTDPVGGTSGTPSAGTAGGSTGTAAGKASRTVTGSVVSTRFGDVQVQVTLSGGTITDVTAVSLPSGGRSGFISQAVEPLLRREALQAQSAQIDLVSGATYTSEAYAESLQAALDQAHA